MYLAQFDLGEQCWRVAAAHISPDAADVLPASVRQLVGAAHLRRFALRLRFSRRQLHSTLLVPGADKAELQATLTHLATDPALHWCDSRANFDALAEPPCAQQLWLNCRGLVAGHQPMALGATLASTWSALRALSQDSAVHYQLNAVHQPVQPDMARRLQKACVRLRALAAEGALPDRIAQGQVSLLERRLQHPWLVDEMACADQPAVAAMLRRNVVQQARAQGLPLVDGDALEDGDWSALWQTGLDASCFEDADETSESSRCWRDDQLLEVLSRSSGSPKAAKGGDTADRRDVFVSHASVDAPLATALCQHLEALGLRCWMAPRDIPPGAHYAESIIQALETCRATVLLMSAPALSSPHVLREVERTVSLRRLLMPVRLVDATAQGAMAYLLTGAQWLDLWTMDLPSLAQRLATSVRTLGSVD